MKNIICFLAYNEAWLSLIVNSILTIFIIWQTFSLAKKQKKQELQIEKRQEEFQKELQRRQLQLDTFEYKNEIYKAITLVGQLTAAYAEDFAKVQMENKSYDQLQSIFGAYIDVLKVDTGEILWKLRQTEYFFNDVISDSVYEVARHLNEITGNVMKFKLYPSILSQEELESYKLTLLSDIEASCKIVNTHMNYLHEIIPKQLNIKDLYK